MARSVVFLLAVFSLSASAAGDARSGKDTFAEECADCHSIAAGRNKKGPHLAGIVGRKAGSVTDFAGYSDAMRSSAIVWTPDKIDAYVARPKAVVPGGRMKYDGLPDATARANVVSYLETLR